MDERLFGSRKNDADDSGRGFSMRVCGWDTGKQMGGVSMYDDCKRVWSCCEKLIGRRRRQYVVDMREEVEILQDL